MTIDRLFNLVLYALIVLAIVALIFGAELVTLPLDPSPTATAEPTDMSVEEPTPTDEPASTPTDEPTATSTPRPLTTDVPNTPEPVSPLGTPTSKPTSAPTDEPTATPPAGESPLGHAPDVYIDKDGNEWQILPARYIQRES